MMTIEIANISGKVVESKTGISSLEERVGESM